MDGTHDSFPHSYQCRRFNHSSITLFNFTRRQIHASASEGLLSRMGGLCIIHIICIFHVSRVSLDVRFKCLQCVFSLEALARICVSGFLFDPEVPTSSMFASPFSAHPSAHITASSPGANSSVFHQASLTRGLSIRQRIRLVRRNVLRPFRLANQPSSPYPHEPSAPTTSTSASTTPSRSRSDNSLTRPPGLEKVQQRIHHLRSPSQPTFFAKALHSDREQSDMISLPFRLNVASVHDKIERNMPYLRHSWGRIDFVAITSFWVTFALATAGLERGSHHIGVFRAMSVLRTARLLAISSGTTVSTSI